jgi:hypothetical protein
MITCHIRYVLDPSKLDEFEIYARAWTTNITRMGGIHHGVLMPSEGANDIAMVSFSFPSLATYESYRHQSMSDPDCQATFAYAKRTKCILRYERSFFRLVTEGLPASALLDVQP